MGIMDTDRDGQISADEWQGQQETFDRFDANNDGYLTLNEIQGSTLGGRGRARNRQARLESMDTNRDGQITPEEFQGPVPTFGVLDANGDGVLAAEELTAGPSGGGRAGRFQAMDANDDGQLSLDEWAGAQQMFRRLDADGDGLLTPDEIPSGRGGRGQQP